jgi:hypothetical protein
VLDLYKSLWDEMFDELIEYKKNHGDCNVPQKWSENKQLAKWVSHQRGHYQNKKLGKDRIKRLEDIGFEWKRISYTYSRLPWEENFDALREYKRIHGDCNVPDRRAENKQLANWVRVQRTIYRIGKLSKARIKRLEDIGFVWDTIESFWDEMFDALRGYKRIQGDCNVPRYWSENMRLGTWVHNQRTKYRDKKLGENRIKRLEDIGFVWDPKEFFWEERFAVLKEYKKDHGNCNVPSGWSDQQLVNWVNNQRMSYRKGKLSDECIKRLEDIGFVWNIRKR